MDLPLSSYSDPPTSTTRLVNCYIEQGGPQGIGPVLRGFPGISSFVTVGDGPIRAALVVHGIHYVVSGTVLYKVVGTTATSLGTVVGDGRPQIASNGIEVCVLVSERAWVYTIASGAFAEITDPDFTSRKATSVQFFDNFLTFTEPGSGRWFSSDLAAATAYNSLNFATAEGAPDNLLAHVVDHRQAFLLGTESCELWDNAGIAGFPFVRNPNGFVEIGCLVGATAQKVDQSVLWLANDYTVRRLAGITPVRVSTHAVEQAIKSYTLAGAYAQTITYEGHVWYVLTFAEGSWIFDLTTQQWFELKSYEMDNWRVSCSTQSEGSVYVGDSQSNKYGILGGAYDEWGDPQVMTWTYRPTFGVGYSSHKRLEIFAEMGVGLLAGQGSDPRIMLEVSNDGQDFFQLPTRSLGPTGNRRARAIWYRLGRARNRVYRASISDPVKRKIVATSLVTG